MRTSLHINRCRHRTGQMASTDRDGMNGAFQVPITINRMTVAMCIVSNGTMPGAKESGLDWEHVSIHIRDLSQPIRDQQRVPTWDEMCWIKELFWNQDEEVIQVHPKKENYVNTHQNVLHLWRPVDGIIRLPNKIMV